ncbi:MAG: SEL1-like repeat protein [Sulfuricaulis sp.]|nr:SEL1-like repeat protein [Sulfuricaulis sp.]
MLLTICLCSAAYAESDGKNIQDAEFKFRIQMTSALNNDPKAQFLVAEMYEQGMGTPQNIRMAHLWYSKSANQSYKPAVEKLANWEREKQQAEARSGERADQQKRRQAEAEAVAAKAERERAALQKRQQAEAEATAAAAKAARERADQQKRRQAEAEAAAAKAAKERTDQQKRQRAEAEAAAVTAAKAERERSEEQRRRQAEAEAAAAAKAAQTVEVAPAVKEKRAAPDQSRDKAKTSEKSAEKGSAEFRANPCNSATAKFTSTCQ